jgi:hypothetical protein
VAIEHKSAGKSLEHAIGQACDYLCSVELSQGPRYVMSSDLQNFLILDLETTEQTAFPIAELPQRLEMFVWIAGCQRRGAAWRRPGPRHDIVERFLHPRRDRPSAAGASLRARKRAAYSTARSSRALALR